MYKNRSEYVYSPSDLTAFLENECVTWLDRYDLDHPGELVRDEATQQDELVRSVGYKHEQSTLAALRAETDVVRIERGDAPFASTIAAMRTGRQVIYQARLQLGQFGGFADFLIRVPGSSEWGNWHYQIWDTKLALSIKPYFAVQLCCYAEMLENLQRRLPERMGIILGNDRPEELITLDYWFYYQGVKREFLDQQRSFTSRKPPPFLGLSDYGHWSGHVKNLLQQRDDISLVANIRAMQVARLRAAGITSLQDLAANTRAAPPRMAASTFRCLSSQARIQAASVPGEPPAFEFLPADPEAPRQGFGLLPPPSPADVAFDIEGYPMTEGGLEYLLGVTCCEDGRLVFKDWWAHDRMEEQSSFENFIDWTYSRWKQSPSMHVYHYASYETTALKRLTCRYASRENELDELLRNQVFVDLYTVVRQALLIGEPAYSLKNVEHLYLPKRTSTVATAGDSIVFYHRWLTVQDGADWRSSPTLRLIRDYNEVDCESTWQLLEWLHQQQKMAGISYVCPEPPNEMREQTNIRSALARAMLAAIPAERFPDSEKWRVHELLAHLLEFHRREQKSLYWKKFERAALSEQELIEDGECLGGLERTASPPVKAKLSLVYEYSFPHQESKLHAESKCFVVPDTWIRFTIDTVDYDQNLLTIKRAKKSEPPPESFSLIPDEIVGAEVIVKSIERSVQRFMADGELPRSLEDFLYRRAPRIEDYAGGPIIREGKDLPSELTRAVLGMRNSILCIQGPPGSGKTSGSGRIIAELLRAGKRVGISSNGHEAICVLMKAAADAADKLGITFTGVKCGDKDRESFHASIAIHPDTTHAFSADTPPALVGGTAWVFSREEARGQFDYLFIDEAGQVCLANLVGMAPAARNLVLLGDQMQLGQPIQGVHPGESGRSILEYFLQDHATIPDDLGVFLPTTWRMRPEICAFISDAIYEGRLKTAPGMKERRIRFKGTRNYIQRPAGIVYVPVEHEGNSCESDEEAAVIQAIVSELVGHTLEEAGAMPRPILAEDILVVAPFNLQVRMLKRFLPGVRVGTVDKFQGQEAPVVILSMTASDGNASPRGIEFLFDEHRLNVAVSRAQVLAVVVASPRLEGTGCGTLKQMKLVNLFCRATHEGLQSREAAAGSIRISAPEIQLAASSRLRDNKP